MNPPATLLIRNARVYTLDPERPWAEALAIVGNRVAWLGSNAEAVAWRGPATREVDGAGGMLLPGFIDSHYHLLLGSRRLAGLKLSDPDETIASFQQRLRDYAASAPDVPWIRVHGWQYRMFGPGQAIHRSLLDAIVPDRPIYAVAFDGHSAWANTVALERAGILHGGITGANSVVVLGDDGLATGELREFDAMDLVARHVPPLTVEEEDALLAEGLRQAAACGITSIHNMDGDPEQIQRYASLAGHGALSLRVYCPMSLTPATTAQDLDELATVARHYQSDMVRGGCVKLFYDGVVEAKTALMLAPYADGSGDVGEANYDQQQFEALVTQADRLGLQVFVHAIGDGAVRGTLDAYERARVANGPRDARHRVEHIEVLDAADVRRFAQLGVIASMQPLHADFGFDGANPWRDLVGPERWALSFPWRTLQDAGAMLALGSDWPVVSQDVLAGIRAALRRPNVDGKPYGASPLPDQRLTLAEILAGYTRQAAYAEFCEDQKGMLRPGMLADAVLLSHDLFGLEPAEFEHARVLLTICDGKIVFQAATTVDS